MWPKWYAKFTFNLHVNVYTFPTTLEQSGTIELHFEAPEGQVEPILEAFVQEILSSGRITHVRRIEYCRES